MASLSDILDDELLMDLAGKVYFGRGEDYFERGAVRSLAQYGDRLSPRPIKRKRNFMTLISKHNLA